ncbi:MAG: beta-ketoacyl synthase N-terminal-like domain-containing protein [Thermodesulfobacteriota bacterium]|nr:beta-ketoacyl synthase N-terminal-like domain-containing protein [Thermodesulfobacteriota bacterium]
MDSDFHRSRHGSRETIAIVGMACSFPKAPDINAFWRNIVRKVDAVTDAPPERFDPSRFYDRRFEDRDKIYSKRGGYLESPFRFNPAEFGIMPKAVTGGEPDQFLVLKTAVDAMRDAGIESGDPARKSTVFMLGRGSYLSAGAFNLLQRTFIADQTVRLVARMHPELPADAIAELKENLKASLKPFEAETAPSVMPNITASRVANRLDLMGPNYIIDAACASSLYAVDAAVSFLLSGRSDLALAGGVHLFNNIPFLNVFCTLGAMSHQDEIRPFDEKADGMLPGEGVGIVVLKRTSDAKRDGNRIYAVIRGIGTSGDGRGISVAAPRVEGEILALERAYRSAAVSPATIGLIEAHGTATTVGDLAEIQSLTAVFGRRRNNAARHCALGSVKSMIGHAMPAAGIASLIKAALSLYHKVLPPTLHCDTPSPKFELEKTPFYINTETRPWFRTDNHVPRRAGVNAFGFGGVNAHVVLEEYETPVDAAGVSPVTMPGTLSTQSQHVNPSCGPAWDSALFLLTDVSRAGLVKGCENLIRSVKGNSALDFMALSHSSLRSYRPDEQRLAIVAESPDDLLRKLEYAAAGLQKPGLQKIKEIKGIYFFGSPLGKTGKVAFMFPGEGAAYSNMMMDLCLHFPFIRAAFDVLNATIAGRVRKSRFLPTQFIFPATLLSKAEVEDLEAEFWKVDSGLQAILSSSLAMKDLLGRFNISPDMIVGHSAGEYSAWIASGILDKDDLYRNQEEIAAIYSNRGDVTETSMAAVSAGLDKVKPILEKTAGEIYISNDNCPHQVVVVGETGKMDSFKIALRQARLLYTELPSREVHHTPLAIHQADPLRRAFSSLSISTSKTPVYSLVTSARYPEKPSEIIDLMVRYWTNPLRFRETIETMYRDGARIFIEVGPGNNLSGFVDDILRGQSFMTVVSNSRRRSGTSQICHLLGMLAAQHVPVSLDTLIESQKSSVSRKDESKNVEPSKNKTVMVEMDLGLPELRLDDPAVAAWQKRLTSDEKAPPENKVPSSATPEARVTDTRLRQKEMPDPLQSKERVNDPRAGTMKKYMNTMSRFLELQKEMTIALAGRVSPVFASAAGASNNSAHPMIGRVTLLEPRNLVRIERLINLADDIFLFDHPFGGDASEIDGRLSPLIVTPLTLNMEIMTEAASLLFPGKIPVGIKNMKAGRWIVVDEETGVRLEAEARATGSSEAAVSLYDRSSGQSPSAEATIIFDHQYAGTEPEAMEKFTGAMASPEAAKRARAMYDEKFMTHGPRFQIVAGLTGTGQNEIIAFLRAPNHHGLFASGDKSGFLINPLLMDACAQVTGYWAQQALTERFITFPAGVGDISFFSEPPGPGEKAWCRMRVRDISDHLVRSDLTISHNNGRLWARITGWTHRRFDLPMELYRFWRFPRQRMISAVSGKTRSGEEGLRCTSPYYKNLNGTIWQKAIGYLYLNRSERQVYKEKLHAGKDTAQWLGERIAAKDAVRVFLYRTQGKTLSPADIKLKKGENGYLMPESRAFPGLERQLALSVSRSEQSVSAYTVRS